MIIAVVNESKHVTTRDARAMVEACAIQLERDVAPAYERRPWPVKLYASRARVPSTSMPLVIADDHTELDDIEDQPLGYHAEDEQGRRWGRVFWAMIEREGGSLLGPGLSLSVILSHEVIEAFVDPDVNLWAEDASGVSWAYEPCDPVQARYYRIRAGGRMVSVSDFVFPTWFDAENVPGARFDHLDEVGAPFGVLEHGYAITRSKRGTIGTKWGARIDAATKRNAAKRHAWARSARRRRVAR